MKNIYVFDVDGTMTPSRLKINPEFKEFFIDWMQDKNVVFVTGSDKEKTIEQIGYQIWSSASACLQSCCNHIFEKGEETYKIDWEPSDELIKFLEYVLDHSRYEIRTSNHIEKRIGLLNFSIVGRDCSQEQREEYYEWDAMTKERLQIAHDIMLLFKDVEASVGGQISIDIHPIGANKSQAKKWILEKFGYDSVIHFFGDKMMPGGNDYDLAQILGGPHRIYSVEDWHNTYKILKGIK
jgi:phosphomannomutase